MKGKDLMTSTYEYADLAAAYDSFSAPAVKIYVNGKDALYGKNLVIDSVQINLSRESVSTMSFQVINAFDLTNYHVKDDVKSLFAVGTVLKAQIGYGSNLTTVFSGYVTDYETSYQETPSLSVTAVDLRKLLRSNMPGIRCYMNKSYSQIFRAIIGNYKKLYKTAHVTSTKGAVFLMQDSTDYNFIKENLCMNANREFYVVGGDVYYIEPHKTKSPMMTLTWGDNLLSFKRGKSYCHQKVTAYSTQENKKVLSASATVTTDEDTSSLTEEPVEEAHGRPTGQDTTTIQNWVDQKTEEKNQKSNTAGGSVIGLPEIVPGRYIKIAGVDPQDAGTFYVSGVSHSIGSDGFTTSFTVGEEKERFTSGVEGGTGKSGEQKKQTGFHGMMRAVVKENWDEKHPGKVLVELLIGKAEENTTTWLPVMQPYCGNGFGFYFLPEVGTEVIVGSLFGDGNSLIVLGGTWNQEDLVPSDTAGEENIIKRIRTKGNHEIVFCDTEDEGEIKISTAQGLSISLNDKDNKISIVDSEEKNGLVIDSENGAVRIKADKKIILAVDGKEQVTVESGKVSLEADSLTEKAKQGFQIQGQKLEMKGAQTEIKADGTMKLNCSGMAEIKGSMVKIN